MPFYKISVAIFFASFYFEIILRFERDGDSFVVSVDLADYLPVIARVRVSFNPVVQSFSDRLLRIYSQSNIETFKEQLVNCAGVKIVLRSVKMLKSSTTFMQTWGLTQLVVLRVIMIMGQLFSTMCTHLC